MIIVQFGLLMFSLSLLIAAYLAPPEAWLTPLHAYSTDRTARDNEDHDDEC